MSGANFDVVIAGAGVVGLAVARALGETGYKVLVVESAPTIGSGVSSRNSEVIHAGLYYPPDSLKAQLCRRGAELLYRYCLDRRVGFRRLGKLIVATQPDQQGKLDQIASNALASGVRDLIRLEAAEARKLEPSLACCGAILSPSTGIVDSHGLMLALQGDAEEFGATFAFNAKVVGGAVTQSGIALQIRDRASAEVSSLETRAFVNAAGLGATTLSRAIDGFPDSMTPQLYLARGCYFTLSARAPFSRLIYPVPVEGALGVHLTLDLAGQARFGPDIEWIDDVDYNVDARRAEAFYDEIRRYWPALLDGVLLPGYAGIRPKISGRGKPAADFRVDGPRQHGVEGLVNLFGIESPGLTASLALAELVRDRLGETP
ncbi:NAD(P)/FAD-dependent oxidoreductase [Methylocystis sp. SC2]|uniref:NAD(P)/FAD-dependent oxidoreductase n=1 Tax=Methylocystis sp. (strain SC2) TaxID=187303 RepID=UPI00027AECA1|nr:NAD(P)/FAD-dependent oxidoreductase [Methylocystis sp. SC2]CCJ07525.1 FAD dependent oxidoreductase [Methylocystis sp. SC2]